MQFFVQMTRLKCQVQIQERKDNEATKAYIAGVGAIQGKELIIDTPIRGCQMSNFTTALLTLPR